MEKPKCNEEFLVSVEVAVDVENCAELTAGEKKTINSIGRSIALNEAKKLCPEKCPDVEWIKDHHVILGKCKDKVQAATYEGYFKCAAPQKRQEKSK